MGISDHLTCLLRNLYAAQEATVRTGHGTDWFQIGTGVHQGCIFDSYLKQTITYQYEYVLILSSTIISQYSFLFQMTLPNLLFSANKELSYMDHLDRSFLLIPRKVS